jgi:hypothetical protein
MHVTRFSLLFLGCLLLVSCGQAGTPGPVAASPTPTAPPSASPSPSIVVSARGAITLKTPAVNALLSSPVTISGDASVFEANVQWRITDTGGRVLADGFTTASQGAPGRGDFSVTATYTVARETVAFIEVYSRSPKDGNIDEIVRIPVTLR